MSKEQKLTINIDRLQELGCHMTLEMTLYPNIYMKKTNIAYNFLVLNFNIQILFKKNVKIKEAHHVVDMYW